MSLLLAHSLGCAHPAPPLAAAATTPVGTWGYVAAFPIVDGVPGVIEYTLTVDAGGATFTGMGVQTNVDTAGRLDATAPETWDFIVTQDRGSVPPYAAGTKLFAVHRDPGGLLVTDNPLELITVIEATPPLFSRNVD